MKTLLEFIDNNKVITKKHDGDIFVYAKEIFVNKPSVWAQNNARYVLCTTEDELARCFSSISRYSNVKLDSVLNNLTKELKYVNGILLTIVDKDSMLTYTDYIRYYKAYNISKDKKYCFDQSKTKIIHVASIDSYDDFNQEYWMEQGWAYKNK